MQRSNDAARIHVCPCCENLPTALARFVGSSCDVPDRASSRVPYGLADFRTPAARRAHCRAFAFDSHVLLTPVQSRMRAVQRIFVAIERSMATCYCVCSHVVSVVGLWRRKLLVLRSCVGLHLASRMVLQFHRTTRSVLHRWLTAQEARC